MNAYKACVSELSIITHFHHELHSIYSLLSNGLSRRAEEAEEIDRSVPFGQHLYLGPSSNTAASSKEEDGPRTEEAQSQPNPHRLGFN